MDTVERLDFESGTFETAAFTLPNPLNEHCAEPLSATEALVYGGQNTLSVYVMDFANNGAWTPRTSLNAVGMITFHASCGSFRENGDLFVIYAGGILDT